MIVSNKWQASASYAFQTRGGWEGQNQSVLVSPYDVLVISSCLREEQKGFELFHHLMSPCEQSISPKVNGRHSLQLEIAILRLPWYEHRDLGKRVSYFDLPSFFLSSSFPFNVPHFDISSSLKLQH